MIDYEMSEYGYWISPDGIIYSMNKPQNHDIWITEYFEKNQIKFDNIMIGENKEKALNDGWIAVTKVLLHAPLALSFNDDVSKKAIYSSLQIIKDYIAINQNRTNSEICVNGDVFSLADPNPFLKWLKSFANKQKLSKPDSKTYGPKFVEDETSKHTKIKRRKHVYKSAMNIVPLGYEPEIRAGGNQDRKQPRSNARKEMDTADGMYAQYGGPAASLPYPIFFTMMEAGDPNKNELDGDGTLNYARASWDMYGDVWYLNNDGEFMPGHRNQEGRWISDKSPYKVEFHEDGTYKFYINNKEEKISYREYGEFHKALDVFCPFVQKRKQFMKEWDSEEFKKENNINEIKIM